MESGALEVDTSAAPGPRVQPGRNIAGIKRQAWAQSRESLWQNSEQAHCDPEEPQQGQRDTQRTPGEPGRVPNKITSWLSECRTPLGASLDDQSASTSRGALRNGCSFEDDLSLGAEANHLQSTKGKTETCFGLAVEQKRSQFKERGRSMNSTGSGKSSTVSSVSELLDLYEEDPEEILLNLGFGQEEPDLSSKVPSRFFNGSSAARGIDIKVYLGAQMQRMELENPNYALTSRFRQIEVLTTVANEFFQLYSQVSGQPVQRISTRDQVDERGEEGGDKSSSRKRVTSIIRRTLSKNNVLPPASEPTEGKTPHQHTQLNGHGTSDHVPTNGHTCSDQDIGTDTEHPAETASPKHSRKKDSCSLATVTEETNGDGEAARLTSDSPEQCDTGPAANGQHQTASDDVQSTNQRTGENTQVVKEEEEKNLDSTPKKPPPTLAPPQLAQLRTENADSFDMEEIQSNDDEALPTRTARTTDLLRTVSQQSDSSGFAEEPSAENSNLKVQVSSDSCDSETTVTSHLSQDVTTPVPMDQPVFDLPDGREADVVPRGADDAEGKSSYKEENKHDGRSEQFPQYSAHQLPRNRPVGQQQNETPAEERAESEDSTISEPGPEPESTHSIPASEQEQQHTHNQTEVAPPTDPPTEGVGVEVEAQDGSDILSPPPPSSSPVLCALHRAKQIQLNRAGQGVEPQLDEMPTTLGRGRGRRPMERSSSLPTSLLSPSRVVSSVRIQFGRGQASCTLPKYSFKYTHKNQGDNEEEEVEEAEGQTNCQSTLYINPASLPGSNKTPTRLPTEVPPKPIPGYLLHSSRSQSSSPPPEMSPGGRGHSWSTSWSSVPNLSSNQQQPGHFQQNIGAKQNLQSVTPGQTMFCYPSPVAHCSNVSPSPSPGLISSPNHFPQTHPPFNLGSSSDLHHHQNPTFPHTHANLRNPHPGSPLIHHQGYSHPYSYHPPYHASPRGSPYASPYLGYHGCSMYPQMGYPYPITHYPPLAHEHNLHPGLAAPAPGFVPGMTSALGQSLHPGLGPPAAPGPGPNQAPSSTEMQLRRVLHDIRGTVQSLSQNRADTPDGFSEHRTSFPSQQSLAEFQQKRRGLNVFRSQMMDLELSIMRQQAMVYKHMSPTDRLEVEQLQDLRSAVRNELQELEQQLEDRLLELTHLGGLHRDGSVDSLSTASALRAMEPMSDLLREQLFLQSELNYDRHAPSTNPSTRSSSPVRGVRGDEEQRQSVYKASINITPALPLRPNAHTEVAEEEGEKDTEGGEQEGDAGGELQEERRGAEGVRMDSLQQLIREIRDSVAQEVRQEIYSELLAAVSPRRSPLPARQHPL